MLLCLTRRCLDSMEMPVGSSWHVAHFPIWSHLVGAASSHMAAGATLNPAGGWSLAPVFATAIIICSCWLPIQLLPPTGCKQGHGCHARICAPRLVAPRQRHITLLRTLHSPHHCRAAAPPCSEAVQELALVAQLRLAAWRELLQLLPLAAAWQHTACLAACCNTVIAAIWASAGEALGQPCIGLATVHHGKLSTD